jgi:Spy/CpxP family protein refolding chaperone
MRHGGGLVRHVIKQLDLSPDQIQQVKTIFASHKADLSTELAALKTSRGQLLDAIHADTAGAPDDTAIKTAAVAVGQAEGNLAVTRAKILGEVRQVLTPDQQAKLKTMLAKARSFGDRFFSHIESRLEDPLAGA